MAKKVVSSVPVHRKKLTKRDKKKKKVLLNLKRVLDFLKSDNYMLAPLVSSQISDHVVSCTAFTDEILVLVFEAIEPIKEKNERIFGIGKVKDYMKSDCYMYAPLVIHQPWLLSSIHGVNPATDTGRKRDSVKNVGEETRDLGQKIKTSALQTSL